jgi:hypothetical protein
MGASSTLPMPYNTHISKRQMTITERNQRLFELRHKLLMKREEVRMVEREIYAVRQQYKDAQMGDLFTEMFGE